MRFMKTRMISGAALLFLTLATLPNGGLAAGQQVQAPKDIVLSIDSLGDLRLDDQRIEFPALTRQLQKFQDREAAAPWSLLRQAMLATATW
jgi:biopolymer transport protein ExbD